jgi:predicted HTH transcriptional regulator
MLPGYSEAYRSGILMMKNACRENRIPEPNYELSERE